MAPTRRSIVQLTLLGFAVLLGLATSRKVDGKEAEGAVTKLPVGVRLPVAPRMKIFAGGREACGCGQSEFLKVAVTLWLKNAGKDTLRVSLDRVYGFMDEHPMVLDVRRFEITQPPGGISELASERVRELEKTGSLPPGEEAWIRLTAEDFARTDSLEKLEMVEVVLPTNSEELRIHFRGLRKVPLALVKWEPD